MATLVLTAVGTALGGPIGGALGAFIGRQADNAIFGGGTREGPRLKELSVTTSSYGQPIPRHFGRMRIGGTIIWSTDLIETSTKQGGGKGQPSTKTYSYSASFAVALGSTELDRIGRIWADGTLLRGANGDLKVGGEIRTYLGTGDNLTDPLISADKGHAAPAFRDCAYVVFEDLQLGDFGNRIPTLTFEVFAPEDQSVSLSQLVPSGLSTSESGELEHARGYSDEGGAIGSALASIGRVYGLSCLNSNDGLVFTSNALAPVAPLTLPQQTFEQNEDEVSQQSKQRGSTQGQEPWALRYYDEDRDYQPSVQRALGLRPDGRETIIDLPAAMSADGAKQLANANTHRTRWQNEQIKWRISELHPKIRAGAIVRVPDMGGLWLIKTWEWFDRGVELELERLAPILNGGAASDPGTAAIPSDVTVPTTKLLAFELPPDNSSDNQNPLIFAAAGARSSGWRGASLFVEQGETLANIGVAARDRAVFGSLTAELGPSECKQIESNAKIEVEIVGEDHILSSTDFTGLAMGSNKLLVGNEVVQFLQAQSTGVSTWRLTGLARGRAGTEDSAQHTHLVGTPVVLIDDRLTPLDTSLIPASPGTRIAALGLADDEPVFTELANVGLSQKPMMPVWPRAVEAGDGSISFCWSRRARGQLLWHASNEVPLVEELERYLVGFGPVATPFATWTTEATRFTLTAIEKSTLVSDYGGGDVWVKQLGTYSNSSALSLTNLS